jgi:acetyl/propionyl-CoA carboxylase alpha subunit
LLAEANRLGHPLVVKSCSGGRGPGERLVQTAERLAEAVRRAQAEAQAVYGARRVYLEKAILPAHQIGVQVLGDQHGRLIHLGEREGSLQYGNRKVIEESPAPCLSQSQRERLWQTALDLARLFNYQGLGTVEFLVDEAGRFYFTEIKARIQVEHPLTEMISRVDLVREQIRLAAGEPLGLEQRDVSLSGWAMLCRIRAEDPWRRFLPSPGRLQRVRLPAGPEIRLDTYVYGGCNIPAEYDSLIAKLTVWAPDRAMCVERMRRALEDLKVVGVPTNLPLLQQVLQAPEFAQQSYSTDFLDHSFVAGDHNRQVEPETHLRDLAVAAAVLYVRRNQLFRPSVPERLSSGWHQDSRRLPQ